MPKILCPPADESQIIDAETKLNLRFNSELKELYTFANGIQLDYVTPLGLTGLIPIHNFLPLSTAIEYYNVQNNFDDQFHNWEMNFKPGLKLFPFLADSSGDCYWVDLNLDTDNYGRIFWTNTLAEDPDYLFCSLTTMFKTISDCYESDVFKLDQDNYLDCDYTLWSQIAMKNNPGIKYWERYNSY